MASTDAQPWPIKNKAFRITFPIMDVNGALVAGATSLDSEISKDGAAFADCTNEATQIATSSGIYYLDLTNTEMNADTVAIIVKSAEGLTTPLVIYPMDIQELSAVPGFSDGSTGLEEILSWILALNRNKITQTATTTTLKKDDGTTNLSTSTVSDDGTTFTRGEFA